jgi:3-mercaptopyruvate sulfurtransferase SseA
MKPDAWVDPGWIAEHLDDPAVRVRVVEVDVSAAAYDARHIPSAVIWDAYKDSPSRLHPGRHGGARRRARAEWDHAGHDRRLLWVPRRTWAIGC